MVRSSSALRPASTNVNPSVEPTTCLSNSSALPEEPDSVILTKVLPSCCGANTHSTVVGVPCPGQSMRIRRFSSNGLRSHKDRHVVHFPVPLYLLTSL